MANGDKLVTFDMAKAMNDDLNGKAADLKSAVVDTSENLFDKTTATTGVRLTSYGPTTAYEDGFVTDFIPVSEGEVYIKNSPVLDVYHRFAFYYYNYNHLSNADYVNQATVPQYAAYMRFCGLIAEMDTTTLYRISARDSVARQNVEYVENDLSLTKSTLRLGYNNVNYVLSTLQVRGHSSASDEFTVNSKYVSSDRFVSDYDIGVLVINDNYNVILHDCTNRTAIGGAAVGKFLPHGTTYVISFTRKDNADITLDEVNSIAIMQPTLVVNDGALTTRLDSRVSYFVYPNSSITDLPEGYGGALAFMYAKPFANSGTMFFEQQFHELSSYKIWRRIVRYDGSAWNNWKLDGTSVESVLAGKNVSIYGDSISTFAGYIPEGNATYYTGLNAGVASVNDTWWKKTIDALGLSLLVNNSWSGRAVSSVRDSISAHATDAGYKEENVLQLKSGTTLPDIIIVKLGINDFNSGAVLGDYDGSSALPTDPTKFLDAYAIMLNLIMTNFPLADVYCCTLMQCERSGSTGFPEINSQGNSLGQWNEGIKKLAHAFGAKVLDHDVCGLTYYNLSTYMGDYSSGSGLHPNASGHSLIANQTIHQMDNAIRTRY